MGAEMAYFYHKIEEEDEGDDDGAPDPIWVEDEHWDDQDAAEELESFRHMKVRDEY